MLLAGAAGGCQKPFSPFNDAAVLTVIGRLEVLRLSRSLRVVSQDNDAVAQAIQSVDALLAAEAERIADFANMHKENVSRKRT